MNQFHCDDIKLRHLRTIELSPIDCGIIANAINVFGSGDHPCAQVDNLDYFDLPYLLDCLDKGIEKCAHPDFKENVIELYCCIHSELEDAKAGTGAYTE